MSMDTIGQGGRAVARPTARLAAVVLAGALVLSACGDDDADSGNSSAGNAVTGSAPSTSPPASAPEPGASPGESSGPASTGSPAASPRPTTTREASVLTEKDSGQTVALAVGESVALRLTNDMLWSTPDVEGNAVALSPVEYFTDPGYTEWAVEAVAAGEAVVRVTGSPQCPTGGDCGPDMDLLITFEVQS